MLTTMPRTTRTATPCRPLTPRQRAQVRQAMASALGAGQTVTRDQVAAELFGATAAKASHVAERPATCDDAAVTPDVTTDEEVTIPDAAARLGLKAQSVRRYLAPSSGKLRRLGAGVSLRSIERLAAA